MQNLQNRAGPGQDLNRHPCAISLFAHVFLSQPCFRFVGACLRDLAKITEPSRDETGDKPLFGDPGQPAGLPLWPFWELHACSYSNEKNCITPVRQCVRLLGAMEKARHVSRPGLGTPLKDIASCTHSVSMSTARRLQKLIAEFSSLDKKITTAPRNRPPSQKIKSLYNKG